MGSRILRMPRAAVGLVAALCIGAPVGWIASEAEADPITSSAAAAAKLLATSLFRNLASEIYKNDCSRGDEPAKVNFICGALGSFSGATERAWKAQIEARLASLRGNLATLEEGQRALGHQIDQLNQQNRALFRRIDQVGPEDAAQKTLNTIDATWEYSFSPLFDDLDSFEREAMLDLAKFLVEEDLPLRIGELSKTITNSGFNQRGSLIELWADSLHAELGAGARDASLVAAYQRFEFEMSRVLFRQRQGLLMHRWAQEVLESECQLNPSSPYCAFRSRWRESLLASLERRTMSEQLRAFNRSVDFLVLAQGNPNSGQANFLPGAAEDIFRRADLFTASSLDQPGLRGRVISMGDRFDGAVKIGDSQFDAKFSDAVKTAGGSLDWWTGTGGVYTEVRFANEWTVYRYHVPDFGVRTDVPWGSSGLPFDSGPVSSYSIDLATGEPAARNTASPTLEFGSFLGIQRAGGGFALLSGQWDVSKLENSHDVRGSNQKLRNLAPLGSQGVNPLVASVSLRADANRNAGGRSYFYGEMQQTIVSRKRISYPDGGALRLNVESQPPALGAPWKNPGIAIGLFRSDDGYLSARTFTASGRVALVFGGADSKNGVVLSKSQGNSSEQTQRTELASTKSESATVQLGTAQPLTLSAQIKYDVSPAAYANTSWQLLARARITNAYLTKP
jgi:hypothetical protein